MLPSWYRILVSRRSIVVITTGIVLVAAYAGLARGTNRNALWRIVSTECIPGQAETANPSPCVLVDAAHGYAVLKDIRGNTQYLLIPTVRVTGIEDPALQDPQAPDYFGAAWSARHYVEQRLGHALPRADIGLAVNSREGRSQDQLHIHIDCLRSSVRDALRDHMDAIGDSWSVLPVPLAGHRYRVRRIAQAELAGSQPFRLMPQDAPAASQTIVAAGVDLPGGRPGFVLLDDGANRQIHDDASGAELLDHACAGAGR